MLKNTENTNSIEIENPIENRPLYNIVLGAAVGYSVGLHFDLRNQDLKRPSFLGPRATATGAALGGFSYLAKRVIDSQLDKNARESIPAEETAIYNIGLGASAGLIYGLSGDIEKSFQHKRILSFATPRAVVVGAAAGLAVHAVKKVMNGMS